MSSNSFPNLTREIYNIHDELLYKLNVAESQCNQIRKLLQPHNQNCKKSMVCSDEHFLSKRSRVLRCKGTDLREKVKGQSNSFKSYLQTAREKEYKRYENRISTVKKPTNSLAQMKDETPENLISGNENDLEEPTAESGKACTVIGEALKKEIPLDILNGIQEVNNYLNSRRKCNKFCEFAKKKYLSHLEKSWEEDFRLFTLFEHDLGDSLKHYLSAIREKQEIIKFPDNFGSSFIGPDEMHADRISEDMKLAQNKVNKAVLKDLSCLDCSALSGKSSKAAVVACYHLLTAIADLKQLRTDFIITNFPPVEEGTNDKKKDDKGESSIESLSKIFGDFDI